MEWSAAERRLLGKQPDTVVAKRTGRSLRAVKSMRRYLRIRACRQRAQPIVWTNEMDALLGTDIDRDVGLALGISPSAVRKRRVELGIDPCDHSQVHPRRDWSDGDIALLLHHTNSEVAKRLGLSYPTVALKRRQLGIPNVRENRKIEWTPRRLKLLGTKPDADLAAELQLSIHAIRAMRYRYGIKRD